MTQIQQKQNKNKFIILKTQILNTLRFKVLSHNIYHMLILIFLSFSINATPLLLAELNPNPIEPSELLDVQITIANPTNSSTGLLSLQVLWPEHILTRPNYTGGASCGDITCNPGEYLFWSTTDLGNLPPGGNITVAFNETIGSSVADGTVIPFEIELFEDNVLVRTISHSVTVQSNSPLELTIDPLSDPVKPGDTLIYELTYGNIGSNISTNTTLTFPIPAGASFVSATDNGVLSGNVVIWTIGDLNVFADGRKRVEIQIDTLINGDALLIDAAILSGTVTFQSQQARAMAVSQVHANRPLKLDVEINPDPVQPSELLEAQITIANPTTSSTGLLSLQVLWPEHILTRPNYTRGAACGDITCNPGEYLFWSTTDLGNLPPGGNVTVAFNETIGSNVADGTVIPFEIELFEDNVLVRTISHSVTVQSNSPLELTIDPLSDPVKPGDTLIYELTYGNNGSNIATNTTLTFPIPNGTSFVSATDNGVLSENTVIWNIGDLNVFVNSRKRVEIQIDSLINGNALLIDAAILSGTVTFQTQQARAMAVSQVHANRPLKLDVEINPGPVQPSELLEAQITIANPTTSSTGLLSLQVLWPEHILTRPNYTRGAACGDITCNPGEYLFWSTTDLGNLPPGGNITVAFNETIGSNVADGTVIPFEIELFEGNVLVRTISHSVAVQSNSPLELMIDPLSDPVKPGDTLVYELTYGNNGSNTATNTTLTFPIPNGTSFVSATGNAIQSGGVVSWDIGNLNGFDGFGEVITVLVDSDRFSGDNLLVDSATLSSTITFQDHVTRAMAISQVHINRPVTLDMDIGPDPIQPDELLDAQITIVNPTTSSTGLLSLRVLWPEHIFTRPNYTGGADCGDITCNPGEYLYWRTDDLGSLPPGGNILVSFSETIRSNVPDGTVIPFEVELFEGSTPIRTISRSILVLPFNATPVAIDDNISVNQGGTVTILDSGNNSVLNNDFDADDVNLVANIISTTTRGNLTLNSNGTFIYTHNGSTNFVDGFDYEVCDDQTPVPACDIGHVNIIINATPIAVDDNITVNQGETVTVLTNGNNSVLNNDTDVNDVNLIANLISNTASGTLVLNGNGTFSYTHNGSLNLTDAFDYEVCDDQLPTPACDIGRVNINILDIIFNNGFE